MSKLYIITDFENYYKIGVTADMITRLSQLQTGNPKKLYVLYYKDFYDTSLTFKIEAILHRMLKEYAANGGTEWVRLDDNILNRLLFLIDSSIDVLLNVDTLPDYESTHEILVQIRTNKWLKSQAAKEWYYTNLPMINNEGYIRMMLSELANYKFPLDKEETV